MSIQVIITLDQINQIKQMLRKHDSVVCIDETTYLQTLLVGQQMLYAGQTVRAKIIKGY